MMIPRREDYISLASLFKTQKKTAAFCEGEELMQDALEARNLDAGGALSDSVKVVKAGLHFTATGYACAGLAQCGASDRGGHTVSRRTGVAVATVC